MNGKIRTVLIFIITIVVSVVIINYFSDDKHNKITGEITIWANNHTYDYLDELAKDYMKNNKRATIKIENINNNEYFNKIVNLNKKDVPNIVLFNSEELTSLMKEKKIKPEDQSNLINTYKMNFSSSRLQEVMIDGKLIAVPLTSRPLVMYLREDVLKEYGYSSSDINTWNDLVKVSEDIYKKSKGKYRALNGTGQDYNDLRTLLIMQNMQYESDKDKIIKNVEKNLKDFNEKNIITKNNHERYFAKISSINGMKSIEGLETKCIWTANNPPAAKVGSNRFFVAQGENLVVLNNAEDKELINSFLEYVSNNTNIALKYALDGSLFPSYIYAYKSNKVEEIVKNFEGKSPLVVMSNISKKAPKINNYNLYKEIEGNLVN
ncbi:ABC transporter substrate-binding protein [Clostridium sardiniense]|uniref:ABC transporter substrate-binding protein n=1 Tax=Clostridium sardiniense TaxID=29369 RepID=A0ABS7KY23_CLOSR|nr:ABC transporter substrate-binding protein [Clostridium sardiniense]MBY0755706.1 ABC transporter substrate-binding protein [Clostridium sardiniense]MDQ0460067.1 multiple sugar transport system substrate-binding protein [Clostridium sardiniense]